MAEPIGSDSGAAALADFIRAADTRLTRPAAVRAIDKPDLAADHPISRALTQAAAIWCDANPPVRVAVAEEFAALIHKHGFDRDEKQISECLAFATRLSREIATAMAACAKCPQEFANLSKATVQVNLGSGHGLIPGGVAAIQAMGDMLHLLKTLRDAMERTLAGQGQTFHGWSQRGERAKTMLAEALAKLGPRLVRPVGAYFTNHGDSESVQGLEVLLAAAERLPESAAVVPPLMQLAERTTGHRRQSTLRTVGRIGGLTGFDALCNYFKQRLAVKDVEAVKDAAWGLYELKASAEVTEATPRLVELLEASHDGDETVRWLVMDALGTVGNAAAIPPLEAVCVARRPFSFLRFGDNKYVHSSASRYRAKGALEKIRERQAVRFLRGNHGQTDL